MEKRKKNYIIIHDIHRHSLHYYKLKNIVEVTTSSHSCGDVISSTRHIHLVFNKINNTILTFS